MLPTFKAIPKSDAERQVSDEKRTPKISDEVGFDSPQVKVKQELKDTNLSESGDVSGSQCYPESVSGCGDKSLLTNLIIKEEVKNAVETETACQNSENVEQKLSVTSELSPSEESLRSSLKDGFSVPHSASNEPSEKPKTLSPNQFETHQIHNSIQLVVKSELSPSEQSLSSSSKDGFSKPGPASNDPREVKQSNTSSNQFGTSQTHSIQLVVKSELSPSEKSPSSSLKNGLSVPPSTSNDPREVKQSNTSSNQFGTRQTHSIQLVVKSVNVKSELSSSKQSPSSSSKDEFSIPRSASNDPRKQSNTSSNQFDTRQTLDSIQLVVKSELSPSEESLRSSLKDEVSKPPSTSNEREQSNTSSNQFETRQTYGSIQLVGVSVKLTDLFSIAAKQLGKAHSLSPPCVCRYCDKRISSILDFVPRSDNCNEQHSVEAEVCRRSSRIKRQMWSDPTVSKVEKRSKKQSKRKLSATSTSKKLHATDHRNEKRFKCEQCPFKFKSKSCLSRHSRVHSGEQPFKCELCPTKFKWKQNVWRHYVRVHSGVGLFKCKQCPAKFKSQSGLSFHSKLYHRERPLINRRAVEVKQSDCSINCRVYSKPIPVKCNKCPEKFKQRYTSPRSKLRSEQVKSARRVNFFHQPRVRSTTRSRECQQRSKIFTENASLSDLLKVRIVRKPSRCEFCPAKFRRKDTLTQHLKVHSEHHKLHSEHLKVHSEHLKLHSEQQFCSQCSAKFRRNRTSRSKVSGKRPFKCAQCLSQFKWKRDLFRHALIHSDLKPFTCESCKAEFRRKDSLTKHLKVHSGERLLKCSQCSAKFNNQKTLTVHKKVHSRKKPLKCEQCSRNFSL